VSLVPLAHYQPLQSDTPDAARETKEDEARARWLRLALTSGLEPAWPSVVAEVTPWGVLVRGMLWRPAPHAEAGVAHPP
jgi:hypothetical protein